jgi:hypothetical protein
MCISCLNVNPVHTVCTNITLHARGCRVIVIMPAEGFCCATRPAASHPISALWQEHRMDVCMYCTMCLSCSRDALDHESTILRQDCFRVEKRAMPTTNNNKVAVKFNSIPQVARVLCLTATLRCPLSIQSPSFYLSRTGISKQRRRKGPTSSGRLHPCDLVSVNAPWPDVGQRVISTPALAASSTLLTGWMHLSIK